MNATSIPPARPSAAHFVRDRLASSDPRNGRAAVRALGIEAASAPYDRPGYRARGARRAAQPRDGLADRDALRRSRLREDDRTRPVGRIQRAAAIRMGL